MEAIAFRTMDPIESALDVAATVLRSGGATSAAERAFQSVLKAHGASVSATVWRIDFIAATRSGGGSQGVHVKLVPAVGVNLAQAAGAITLADRVERGEVAPADVGVELAKVQGLALPYAAWLRSLAAATGAAGFALLTRLGWTGAAIAAVAAAAGQTVRARLQERGLPAAQVTLVSGAVSALLAGGFVRAIGGLGELPTLAASAIYMVPGIPLINGYLDLLSHKFLVVGLQRIANAAVIFLTLAIVIALAYVVI